MRKISFGLLFCIILLSVGYAQKIAIKNNVLYDAAAIVNVGGEYAITKNISANIAFNYNGWSINQPILWKHIMVQPEARYWLREVFNEHFVGVHLVYSTFDIERINLPMFGFQRKYLYKDGAAYGAGLSYGYNLYLTPRLNIEFNVGAGYLSLKYKKYLFSEYSPANDVNPVLTRSYIGPTQVGISVVYIIK